MTILAIVNANKEGQIESKMMKSRQMEEIREARRKEAEVRQEQRHSKLVRCHHLVDTTLSSYCPGRAEGLYSPQEECEDRKKCYVRAS